MDKITRSPAPASSVNARSWRKVEVAKTAEERMMCFGLRLVPVEYLLDGEGGIELVVEDKVEVDMLGELSRS